MKLVEDRITQFIHSPAMTWLLAVGAVVMAFSAYPDGAAVTFVANKGLGLPSPNTWITSPSTSFFVNLMTLLAIAGMMLLINSRFNLLRDITRIYAGIFLLLQVALPSAFCVFTGGTFLALVVLCCNLLLFTVYNRPYFTRYIFLIFCMLSAGALTQYAFIAYIPVFFLGCVQMRVFSPRMIAASLMGLVTPAWICWAFGIIDFSTLQLPDFESFAGALTEPRQLQFYSTVCLSMVTGVTLCIINMIKVMNYNMRSRSYNGFISVMLFATSIMILIDFTNITAYATLLNVCTAYQVGQFFVINIKKRSYIAVLAVIAIFVSLYFWWTII